MTARSKHPHLSEGSFHRALPSLLAVLASMASPALIAAEPSSPAKVPVPVASELVAQPDLELTVSETALNEERLSGVSRLSQDEISRQTTASGDLNELARSFANVQFDARRGRLTEDNILDLRPAQLSISGGRPYENAFVIEGLQTASLLDSTNDNIHAYDSVLGHPQTTFLAPGLVGSMEIYTHDIPARFGGFTGGVIKTDIRDPRTRFGGEISASHSSSDLVEYLVEDRHQQAAMPEKPEFHRESFTAQLDIPLARNLYGLFSYSSDRSTLSNTQKLAAYGSSRRATTRSDDYTAKLLYVISKESSLSLTSVYSPYRQQNIEQDLKIQNNDSWLNSLRFTHRSDLLELTASAGALLADNSREQAPNLYTYKNFGAGDKVDWVADTASSGARGGNGDMTSTQTDLPLSVSAVWRPLRGLNLSGGADFTHTRARLSRPETNNAYRHQTSSGVVKDPTVVSALGGSDPTVLEGEQALNYRLTYLAFDHTVRLNTGDAWLQAEKTGSLGAMPWELRAGLRAEQNDFLGNLDLAPRLSASLNPLSWLRVQAGYNRYYTDAMLAYALREGYPDSYTYNRTYTLVNGKKVYSDNWKLYLHSRAANYSQADLDTPYSDERSASVSLDGGKAGTLRVTGLQRDNRNEFARSEAIKRTYVNEKTGTITTYNEYRITNDAWSDYRSLSLEWTRAWKNQRARVGTTWEKRRTTTVDYFEENLDDQARSEMVYLDGNIVTRAQAQLADSNFARPTYVTGVWSSSWFGNRLRVDLIGRWNAGYSRIEDTLTTITLNSVRYDRFQTVRVPANLINDLNLQWTAIERRAFTLGLELKVGNLLNRTPYARGVSISSPYQAGRSLWASTNLRF